MRIAVSGTHAIGKSTLAEDFVEKHPEFVLEPEPYSLSSQICAKKAKIFF